MQERFEETAEPKTTYSIPIGSYEEERRALLAFKALWKRGDSLAAEQVLNGMKTAQILETQIALCDYVLSPVVGTVRGEGRQIDLHGKRQVRLQGKQTALRLIALAPRGEIVPILVQLLNHPDPVIAQEASDTLQKRGKNVVPELLRLYAQSSSKRRVKWTEEGLLRLIKLLGNLEDRRATRTLLGIAHGEEGVTVTRHNELWNVAGVAVWSVYAVMSLWLFLNFPNMHTGLDGLLSGLFTTTLWLGSTCAVAAITYGVQRACSRVAASLSGAAIDALGKIGDKRALSDLCYFVATGRYSAEVARALNAILPAVTDIDSLRLRSREVEWLTKAIFNRAPESPDLPLRVLKSLAHLGNEESLVVVERLTERGESESIRAEAQRVLPILRERLARVGERRNLLRASEPPHREYETLLRPYK